jgi:hypothetical protein
MTRLDTRKGVKNLLQGFREIVRCKSGQSLNLVAKFWGDFFNNQEIQWQKGKMFPRNVR